MAKKDEAFELKSFQALNLAGGLNSRAGYFGVSDGSQAPLETIDSKNVDYTWAQAASTRMPFKLQGYIKQPSFIIDSQATENVSATATSTQAGTLSICQFFENIGGSSQSFNFVNFRISPQQFTIFGKNYNFPQKFKVSIHQNVSGKPTSVIYSCLVEGTFYSTQWPNNPQTLSIQLKENIVIPNNIGMWLCVDIPVSAAGIQSFTFYGSATQHASLPCYVTQDYVNFTAFGIAALQFSVYAQLGQAQRIFDMRTSEPNGTVIQNVMGVNAGALYTGCNSFAPTELLSGGNQSNPWDMQVAGNLLFSCDYATLPNQVWDASSSATGLHGYRMSAYYNLVGTVGSAGQSATIASWSGNTATMNASQSANGLYIGRIIYLNGVVIQPEAIAIASFTTSGTIGTANYYVTAITFSTAPIVALRTQANWNSATIAVTNSGGSVTSTSTNVLYKILAVTQLNSGGLRASEEQSVTLPASATSAVINLTNVYMNSSTSGAYFGTDIPNGATTWYIAGPFNPQAQTNDSVNSAIGGIYYQLGTSDLSTTLNPMANSTSSFNITALPATTANTLLINTGLAQAFFQSQVDVPQAKFMVVWQNMLVMAGDPLNPSSIWLSYLGGPQIFSLNGGVNGTLLPIPDFNDGQIVRGLYVFQGNLYVFKNQSVYRVLFTGASGTSPYVVTKLMGNIGCLSHWSITETNQGIVFLSEQGPAICYGTIIDLIPVSSKIMDRFQSEYPESYNLANMITSSGVQYKGKKQVWWNTCSHSSTFFDGILIYDYEKQSFSEYKDVFAQFLALVGDSNDFQLPWYAGLQEDFGNFEVYIQGNVNYEYIGQSDLGIPFEFSTGWLQFGDPSSKKSLRWLYVFAELYPGLVYPPSQALLGVNLYLDYGTNPIGTYYFDLNNPLTILGGVDTIQAQNQEAHVFKLQFFCGDYGALLRLHGFRLDWQTFGTQA